jgi:hypothetical protein
VLTHGGIPGLVGAESACRKDSLAIVDDLDGRRQLVGIDPNEHRSHVITNLVINRYGLRGGHCYYELGSPFWSHASTRHPAVSKPKESHTNEPVGSRKRASRRAPGPSLARRRSYQNRLVAASDLLVASTRDATTRSRSCPRLARRQGPGHGAGSPRRGARYAPAALVWCAPAAHLATTEVQRGSSGSRTTLRMSESRQSRVHSSGSSPPSDTAARGL